jgi:hypothetical protein
MVRALHAGSTSLRAKQADTGRFLVQQSGKTRLLDRDADLPRLAAAYRVLASLVVKRALEGRPVRVQVWERPWVRDVWCPRQQRVLRVTVPAGGVLEPLVISAVTQVADADAVTVLLLPDLGTAPVARYREVLRRLVILREAQLDNGLADSKLELVIVAPDPDRRGTRSKAWLELLDKVARRLGQPEFPTRVVGWEQVSESVGDMPRLNSGILIESGRGPV